MSDVLRRLVEEMAEGKEKERQSADGGTRKGEATAAAGAAGGSLRKLALGQLYEVLETLIGLWKREAWVRPQLQEALALAARLQGGGGWSKEQHGAIARWLSTIRARTS